MSDIILAPPKPQRKLATRDSVEKNFVKVPRYFIERGKYLTPPAKWVWVTLKTHENAHTKRIFPSHERIEQLSGLSRTAVNKALKELADWHWIVKTKRPGRSTTYRLTYGGQWNDPQKEAALEPLPDAASAKAYKSEHRANRAAKNGTFAQNANDARAPRRGAKG